MYEWRPFMILSMYDYIWRGTLGDAADVPTTKLHLSDFDTLVPAPEAVVTGNLYLHP